MSVTTRFAPSPTGRLHAGNARTALVNWLFTRVRGGRFILRLDDTDAERSTEAFAAGIVEDLAWLGLDWDALERQSARLDRYEEAASRLKAAGRLYPCYESAEDLAFKRNRQRARGLPPIYDRAALVLTAAQRAELEAEGLRPHWRFLLDQTEVSWLDLVQGESRHDAASVSDPVLIREDGTFLYMLPSVVDDIDMGVTHVLRGEDHLSNSAIQIQLCEALGGTPPAFGHLPLMVMASGEGLSKREGSLGLADLRAMGFEPQAVAAYLAHLGQDGTPPVVDHARDLVAGFALGPATHARFDLAGLEAANAAILHELAYEAAAPRLRALGLPEAAAEGFWAAIRDNLTRLDEARDWWRIVAGDIPPAGEDAEMLASAADLLPPEPWSEASWGEWTAAVRAATGRKGRALFHPLRLALTGRDQGPELKALLPLMGRERALARLRAGAHLGAS